MSDEYVFGKRIVRKRASTFRGTGHQLPQRAANNEADFVPARSTLNIAPVNSRPRSGTFGRAQAPIRKTAVAQADNSSVDDPVAAAMSTEATAPVYSSFAKRGTGPGWRRPTSSKPFKDFALDGSLNRIEPTEFTTETHSSIKVEKGRASSFRVVNAASAESRDHWLKPKTGEVPGPGSYFVP